jgi:hypothetical protein
VLCAGLLALSAGCASSASVRHEENLKGEEKQRPQENKAFREAAEQYLWDMEKLRRNSPNIVLVARTMGAQPR